MSEGDKNEGPLFPPGWNLQSSPPVRPRRPTFRPPAIPVADRERFDELLEDVLSELPEQYRRLLDEKPLIVDDYATPALVQEIIRHRHPRPRSPNRFAAGLCGLHTGVPLTMRSVHQSGGGMPEVVRLFRWGILNVAGGWNRPASRAELREQIRITLLHEIGHHFGLNEEDLRRLGYG